MKTGNIVKIRDDSWCNLAGKHGLLLKPNPDKRYQSYWLVLVDEIAYEIHQNEMEVVQ